MEFVTWSTLLGLKRRIFAQMSYRGCNKQRFTVSQGGKESDVGALCADVHISAIRYRAEVGVKKIDISFESVEGSPNLYLLSYASRISPARSSMDGRFCILQDVFLVMRHAITQEVIAAI